MCLQFIIVVMNVFLQLGIIFRVLPGGTEEGHREPEIRPFLAVVRSGPVMLATRITPVLISRIEYIEGCGVIFDFL
jgi:hypothetical protein